MMTGFVNLLAWLGVWVRGCLSVGLSVCLIMHVWGVVIIVVVTVVVVVVVVQNLTQEYIVNFLMATLRICCFICGDPCNNRPIHDIECINTSP